MVFCEQAFKENLWRTRCGWGILKYGKLLCVSDVSPCVQKTKKQFSLRFCSLDLVPYVLFLLFKSFTFGYNFLSHIWEDAAGGRTCAGTYSICCVRELYPVLVRRRIWWAGDDNIVCGEAKEICLVIPCCPSVNGVGLGEVSPAHSVLSLSLLDRETLEMYAMLEKFICFLRRLYRCTIVSSATKCKWMWWEYL